MHRQVFLVRVNNSNLSLAGQAADSADRELLKQAIGELDDWHRFQARFPESWEDFFHKYDGHCPSCLIVMAERIDPGLPSLLAGFNLNLPRIMLTRESDPTLIISAMRTGIHNMLAQPCRRQELAAAIVEALEKDACAVAYRRFIDDVRLRARKLSANEMKVLRAMYTGTPNRKFAKGCDVGLRTVETRRAKVRRKMQAKSQVELLRMVCLAGLFNEIDEEQFAN